MNDNLIRAAGLGAVTGLRSMTGLAAYSRQVSDRRWLGFRPPRADRWLADDRVAATLTAMAAGELIVDKLPGVPARVEAGPLLGRGAIGAIVGGLVAGEDDRVQGALLGGLAALGASFLGWFLRREIGRVTHIPDPALALAEDAIAVAAALELTDGM